AKFRVTYGKPSNRKYSTAEAPLAGFRKVRSSSGETEERPVIETAICIMGQCWKSEITLTSRQSMQFAMLLGRACLRKRFIVDPSRANLSAKQEVVI
ncbi:MAG: RimK/LysX family protein, partial [Phycisphaerales bacterium]|nr:RimK/LysX family protein [Phycisphaerales bacterium]